LNNAGQSKYFFGPIGAEHGIKYDGAWFLQIWTETDNDFKIVNGEDGAVLFNIDTSTGLITITNDLTIDNNLIVGNDLTVTAKATVDDIEVVTNGIKLPSYATGSLPAAGGLTGYFVHDSTLNKIVRSNGATWDTM
ncbi:hypothetical protein COB55_04925, partial [Candidatus Wolfebacteria bacterium]